MNFSKEDMNTILNRINTYADQVLEERDPAKVPIRVQLDALKPEMEKLAAEYKTTVEDIFIAYMDMNTQTVANAEADLQSKLNM